ESAVEVEFVPRDTVVMTQSCDLENDTVQDLLRAQVWSCPELVQAEASRGNPYIRVGRSGVWSRFATRNGSGQPNSPAWPHAPAWRKDIQDFAPNNSSRIYGRVC